MTMPGKIILLFALLLFPVGGRGSSSKSLTKERSWSAGALLFKLTGTDFQVQRDTVLVFSATERLRQELDETRMRASVQSWAALPSNKLSKATYQVSIQPLAVVGTLLSFRLGGHTVIPGDASDQPWEYVSTWDLAVASTTTMPRPEPRISLLDLWPEADILAALLEDDYVRKLLPKSSRPESLAALWKMLDDDRPEPATGEDRCAYDVFLGESTLRAFAFLRVEESRVALRLHLTGASEQCRSAHKQLTIWLPIPEKLREPLGRANPGEDGYLLKDVERLGIPEYRLVTPLAELLRSPVRRRK